MKSSEENAVPIIEKNHYSHDQKKHNNFKSPDIAKMQVIVIDDRTKIYIPQGADPVEARNRYLTRLEAKNKVVVAGRKPAATTEPVQK
jgi:hypothetical protein